MKTVVALLLLTATCAWSQGKKTTATFHGVSLQSPDKGLVITFDVVSTNDQPADGDGRLVYSVLFQGKPVIEQSALRLELNGRTLGNKVHIAGITPSDTDETYRLVTGKASLVRNHFNALRLETEESGDEAPKLVIETRAYDDAVAFRYVVPEQPALSEFVLTNEHTEFRVSKDAMCYALMLPNFQSQYEGEFLKLPVSAFAYQGGVIYEPPIGLPILMNFPGVAWVAITEADVRDYAAMYLMNTATGWPERWFVSKLAPHPSETNVCVTGSLPHHSAWRVIMVADEPGKLIESTVITSLNPESQIADTSWIRAGKCAWNWWGGSIGPDGKSAFNMTTMKHYVDFAAKSGLEYMLVDAGWSPRDDITKTNSAVDIPALIRYAAPKGVRIWVWAHWTAVQKHMDEAFPLFEKWGVAGVKIDFMSRDDQEMIGFYYRVAEKAAQHHLMVDFHGATKPTGLERTWPNVLGYEGVMGMEWSKATARDNPAHHLMIPFTRMLAGPMDYTPGGFDNVTEAAFEPLMEKPMVMGTRAHQLAMYVVYECPFQMVSDAPTAYEGQPAFEFIKQVPATWDETHVLNGLPGEYIAIARRHGDEWFLGSMSNWTPRELDVPLDFLGKGNYTAEIYADAKDADKSPKHVVIETKTVKSTGHLKIQLAPGGGCAVRFKPKN